MGLNHRQLEPTGLMLITYACPVCSHYVSDEIEDIACDYLDLEGDGARSVQSVVECGRCDTELTFELTATLSGKQIKSIEYPDLKVAFYDNTFDRDEEYDDFLSSYEPHLPYDVFSSAINELKMMGFPPDNQVMLKMLYLQYVVVLETYLSDRLIELIGEYEDALALVVESADDFKRQKISYAELARDQFVLKKRMKEHLQKLSFHNLPAVAPMFKATLKVDIFNGEERRVEIMKIIENRHHIVHRNGRDPEGKLIAIDANAVRRVHAIVNDIADRVEEAFERYKHEQAKLIEF